MAFMVNVKPTGVEVSFTVESLDQAIEAIVKEKNALHELMGLTFAVADSAAAPAAPEAPPKERKPRNKNQPDPATASAPPPAPVPQAAPPAPVGDGIPPFLKREVPPLVASPPPPLAPPPASALGKKVATEIQRRHANSADSGKSMLEWVYSTGITPKGATIDEILAVVELQTEDKLRPIAQALGVQ